MIKRLLPICAALLARTLRFEWHGPSIAERSVVMFWHGSMFAGWWCVRKRAPIALVSASKDGNILNSVLVYWGYRVERGSSGKNGMEALLRAMKQVEHGVADTLVLTPDGPRGPAHVFKRGGFIAAHDLDVPIYLLEIECKRAITLGKSWDQFQIPLPFSKVSIATRKLSIADWPTADRAMQDQWLEILSKQLLTK